jgi:hypothetical protein
MFRGLLCLMLFFGLAAAQLNMRTIEYDITNFRADSTYTSAWASLTDYENTDVTILINDTTSAGYTSDSIAAKYSVQYGGPYKDYLGALTTVHRGPPHLLDSIRAGSGRWVTNSTWLAYDSFPETLLDTTTGLGYALNLHYIQPYVNPMFRIILTGLTGNKKGAFLRVRIVITQRKWQLAGKN